MPVRYFNKAVTATDVVVGAVVRPVARRILWATGKTPHILGTRLWIAGWLCYWIGEAVTTLRGLVRAAGTVPTSVFLVAILLATAILVIRFIIWNLPMVVALGKDLAAVRSVSNGRLLVDPDPFVKLIRAGFFLLLLAHAAFDVSPVQLGFDAATHLSISLGLYMLYEKKPPTTLRSTAKAKLAAARARLADIQWAPTPAPSPI